jgi:hypothetical protein
MEHRWGRRIDCQIPVVVEAPAHPRLRAHMQNLSLTGAFLAVSTEEELPPRVCVRLEPASASPYHRHRIWAYVVRQTCEGIGLEWADFAPRVICLHFALPPEEIQIIRLMRVTKSDPAIGVRV